MPNILSSGTLTASSGEQDLYRSTGNHNYLLTVDLTNMVTASASSTSLLIDVVEIYAKVAVLSSTTYKNAYVAAYQGAQSIPIKVTPPVDGAYGVAFTLRQYQGGAARTFDWRVDSIST